MFDNKNEFLRDCKEIVEVKSRPVKRRKSFKNILIFGIIFSIIGGFSIGVGYKFSESYLSGYAQNNGIVKEENQTEIIDSSLAQKVKYNQTSSPIADIAEEVGPSIVAITSKVKVRDWFDNQYVQEGQGSGVIFDVNNGDVMIVTNEHVVDGAAEVLVTLYNNKKAPANIVGIDSETDLAVLRIDKKDIPKDIANKIVAAKLGDSDILRVGETAIAIGNPMGYNNTVTVGVISALNREIRLPDKKLELVQTDAAINPGNSGGALVNINGEVIGINTIKITDTKVEGIGFAIPINSAKPIINELVENGSVSRPYLGIYGKDIDKNISELYELPMGVFVADVIEKSAADIAGIKKGDVIIEFEGEKIFSMEQLSQLIKSKEVGDKVIIKIIRNGNQKKELKAVLQEKS
ncbi:S1C family serine protease [Paramaledivibacter caminithermalis]|jgi:serine protease Do|uniref:Serine protease Do n=1 Tax=Paramaledivibacter caminithermalis (strain DSM 15212 / CIP 107654 / DViRD3) TaxID=1121301 RepID=A0A1M6K1X9_PARC5|nr:trypsin-like peptidase domain-containing protein [Paramaledivibacter caminithermalis]SHJ52979.1 serine protease Do [Paramaledivibacter caminithermalis DSM 15212]